ncbi:MAG: hypothetical protein EA424_02800 [Planctomycetaceae bacterium]|nr:MAG: hypothetical protein EA424_02800 [Planctomycetaceae bacterium]
MMNSHFGRCISALVVFSCLSVATMFATASQRDGAVEGYADFDTLRIQLEELNRSPFANLSVLGRTREGREIFLVTIGKGRVDDRPGILVIGGLDATQLYGSELAVRVARRLVQQAADDSEVAGLLDRITFYIIPRASPDACEFFFIRPFEQRTTNTRPTDDDHDGRVDEDPPNDLDGDGWITAMRVEQPGGRYIAHPDDPRVMILADPAKGERGRWTLHEEGSDLDGDGRINEDPVGGVAFDRNWTFNYPYFEKGAGPFQISEPETQAVADFAFGRRNIALMFTFTTQDNLFHLPKSEPSARQGRIKTKLLEADSGHLERIGKLYRELHGGSDSPSPPAGQGSISDWAYFHYGRWSLAGRAWWIPKSIPTTSEDQDQEASAESSEADEPVAKPVKPAKPAAAGASSNDSRGRDDLQALAWFASQGIDGFVPWRAIEHPDFPGRRVQIGGFQPYRRSNPPLAELDGLDGKHVDFFRQLAGMLPRLRIPDVRTESLGGGVWRIKATVVNEGTLPTFPQMGEISRQTQPVQIAIELPDGAALITSHARRQLPTLAGSGGHVTETFLIRLEPDFVEGRLRLRAWAPSVGSTRRVVSLSPSSR